jgi:hypothetical protein
MALYGKEDATLKALEFTKLAIDKGLLGPVSPNGFGNPADAGKKTAEFVGGFIKQLTKEIESL